MNLLFCKAGSFFIVLHLLLLFIRKFTEILYRHQKASFMSINCHHKGSLFKSDYPSPAGRCIWNCRHLHHTLTQELFSPPSGLMLSRIAALFLKAEHIAKTLCFFSHTEKFLPTDHPQPAVVSLPICILDSGSI